MSSRLRARVAAGLLAVAAVTGTTGARADMIADCFSEDNERRIEGCSRLIEMQTLDTRDRAVAYAMRALAYSLKGQYANALPDYDSAIALDPYSSIALNNRAWAKYRSGQPEQGIDDVERALALAPGSPHAHDTRAHIRQSTGRLVEALADYEAAMRHGGERIIKLYQCGLQARGLYNGQIDGRYSQTLRVAMRACVGRKDCDPLPAEEECREATS